MKKVLFVATVTSHIKAFHIPYLKWFKENGYEVHVASNGESEIPFCDKHYQLDFERFPIKFKNLKVYYELKKIINKNNYEIIHCHTPVGGVITRLAAKNARQNKKTKVIYTAHGFHFYKGAPILNWLIYYPIEKLMSRYTDTLITINKEDYDIAKRKFKADNIELIYGVGVEKEKFDINMTEREKENLRKEIGISKEDFVVTLIGELNKNKNQIMAINAMKELKNKDKHIKLLLVGAGVLEKEYKNVIKKENLEDNVKMLGYRQDIPKLLKISNILISLSFREGLPVNVIEGLTSGGLPIIVSNCRGSRQLIQNGENGFVIEQNNIQELIEKIKYIRENQDKFKNIKENKYCLTEIMNKYVDIYTNINKKCVLFLRSTSIVNDSRAFKEINFYKDNYKVIALGWNRQKLQIENTNNVKYDMYEKKAEYGLGMKNIANLLFFEIWIYRKVKKYLNKCDIIHACDFDTAFIASKFARKKKFIYDVYDYYVDCHNLSFLNKLVEKLDIKTINKADTVIICTENRMKQIEKSKPKHVEIIYNSPDINIKPNVQYFEDKIKICYVGILQENRLLTEIADVIKNNKKLELHIGGFGIYEKYFEELSLKYDNIFYYGSLTYEKVLELENTCNILFATYNPSVENHKYSAPNKVYEAMALGKPIIVCNNTGVDKLVNKLNIGFSIEYDAKEFEKVVNNISQEEYYEISENGIQNYKDKYSWKIMEEKLKKVIENN